MIRLRERWARRQARLVPLIAVACALGAPSAAHAQDMPPGCAVPVAGGGADVCRKAGDLFAFVVPQVGVALAGGNHILGEGGTLGGWGKRIVSVRVSAVDGGIPTTNVPLLPNRPPSGDQFGAKRFPMPVPSLDAAVGIWAGFPMGLTNIGGIDLLVGAAGIPGVSAGAFSLKPQNNRSVAFSYGVRIGALQESSFIPGLSVSWLRRGIPNLDFNYTPGNDTLAINDLSVSTSTLRLVASKRFTVFGLAAGIGRDQVRGESAFSVVVNEPISGTEQRTAITFPAFDERVTRTTGFVNASFGVAVLRVVIEYGRSNGEARETLNSFGSRRANESYSYGSLGITTRF